MKWIKALKIIIPSVIIFVVSLFLGFLLNCSFGNGFHFVFDVRLFGDGKTWLYTTFFVSIAVLIALSYYYKHYWLKNSKKIMKGDKQDNDIQVNLEQAKFETTEEINRNFTKVNYGELATKKVVGIPVRAEEHRGKYTINLASPTHTLIIGTTGSGKTTSFINPTIQILSQSAAKPSLFISDPKGELFSLHAKTLKAKGYKVKVLDLRNPFNSVKWNPLERSYLMYQRMLHLDDEVTVNEENGTFVFEGKEYFDPQERDCALQVKKQQLYDEVYENLHDIVSALCPILNKNEPIWESGAKNFILAIVLAMLEDSENPSLGMTVDKFNFYNLTKIATNTENDCDELMKYFKSRSQLSKSVGLSKQVLDSADKTRGSYLSTMFDKLNMFADLSLCSLTSKNELRFEDMVDRPTALFLQIPDEKETRHPLASLVILQAYKELVAKANTSPDLSLDRDVFFLLDEFGNLPQVHKLEQMITVGRSRRIWLCLVVQSYAQLAKVYDEKVAEIIKSNCNIQVFIGTTDLKTIEDFSKRCGNYTVITRNVGYNTVKADDINSNASIKERPLIYPSELQQLNRPKHMGNAIVTVFGFQPIKSKFTPSYSSTVYSLGNSKRKERTGRYFDEANVFYDMLSRNKMLCVTVKNGRRAGTEANKAMNKIQELQREVGNVLDGIATDEQLGDVRKMIAARDFQCAIDLLENAIIFAIQQDREDQAERIVEVQRTLQELLSERAPKFIKEG